MVLGGVRVSRVWEASEWEGQCVSSYGDADIHAGMKLCSAVGALGSPKHL